MIKTRFSPSPTGQMHIGNVRTALFCALYAQGQQGVFMLRIEDTDKERSKTEYTEGLMADLRWLGLQWQEGPEVGGAAAPYFQSERQAIYDQYYHQLEASGRAYTCFCSEAQLALARKVQRAAGQPPRYPGTCRHLTPEQIARKRAEGIPEVLRFRIPDGQAVRFTDLVHGEEVFNCDDIGDFIIRRSDGTSPFMFCNAIDDSLMGVTHALRGTDHLANTPRQLLILEALGLKAPQYGHTSLIMGDDGTPLSKRNGSRSVRELREMGYLPLAINNYLARLGHYFEDPSFMDFAGLAKAFSLEHLNKSPARYDTEQLLHWQKEAVARLSNSALWTWLGEAVQAAVPVESQELFIQTVRANTVFPQDALLWAQRIFKDGLEYDEEAKAVLTATAPEFFTAAITAVQTTGTDYAALCEALKTQVGVKGKALFQPLRFAVTGSAHGPELVHIFSLMGAQRLIKRFEKAKTLC